MLKIDKKLGLAHQKESIFRCSCRLWLLSWRRARVFARYCSLLSKYLSISWKQRKEQSHAQCHVTHWIRIFDKISEHAKVAKSVDIAVPELAVTSSIQGPHSIPFACESILLVVILSFIRMFDDAATKNSYRIFAYVTRYN